MELLNSNLMLHLNENFDERQNQVEMSVVQFKDVMLWQSEQ